MTSSRLSSLADAISGEALLCPANSEEREKRERAADLPGVGNL